MRTIQEPAAAVAAPRRSVAGIAGRLLLHGLSLLVGLGALVAHEHFALQGNSALSMATLVAAGGFALSPLRAILHEIFAIEGKALHLAHGIGGLSLVGLTLGGAMSGAPLVPRAALAPFEMMGAAQALMHQNHPRNAAQAAALQQFATSLPEVEAFTHGDLTSPANAQRAVVALDDILTKAQRLGQTELRADPDFQSALRSATSRFTLSLGLDATQKAIESLAGNPATASAVPGLERKVAAVRRAFLR
jgi:hypothetical protein